MKPITPAIRPRRLAIAMMASTMPTMSITRAPMVSTTASIGTFGDVASSQVKAIDMVIVIAITMTRLDTPSADECRRKGARPGLPFDRLRERAVFAPAVTQDRRRIQAELVGGRVACFVP